MNQPTAIGFEDVARLHDQAGQPVLAAIHRLTTTQARDALAFLSGYAPAAVDRALADATGTHLAQVADLAPPPVLDEWQEAA